MKIKGFTLVEVLVAMLILLIGILGYYSLFGAGARHRHYTYRLGEAIFIAKGKVEEMKAMDFGSLTSGNETIENFQLVWSVSEVVPEEIKEILLVVGWGGTNCRVEDNEITDCSHTLELRTSVLKQE